MLVQSASRLLRVVQACGAIVLTAAACATSPEATRSSVHTAARPQTDASASSANLWLIFIDDLHLDFTATGRLKALFKTIADELVKEGDLFGVVSTGPSSIAIDSTRDRRQLEDAHARISGAALKPSEILSGPADKATSEVRYRAHVSFSTAYGVMKSLERLTSRRKAFIYVSNGYAFDLRRSSDGPLSFSNPFLITGNQFSVEQLREEVAELARQAKRANVTIYGIDPRALSGPPVVDPNVDDVAWQKYWATTRNSLQVIAEETGGFALQDQPEFLEGLARIRDANRR
jgi:VWFA-related protein